MERRTAVAAALIVISLLVVSDVRAVGPDKVLTWQGGSRGEVRFEGKEHAEEGLDCKACHPGIFSMKHGTTKMTMADLNSGRYCGACHNGTAAFSTQDPKECHECHRSRSGHREHGERRHGHDDD